MQAICRNIRERKLDAEIGVIVSDNPQAPGLSWAQEQGFNTAAFSRQDFQTKKAFEKAIVTSLQENMVNWVVLAGYMRLVGPTLLRAYERRILNIHPSLLPAFPGLHAQAQALAYGVKIAGCTVHLVDHTLDGGPILAQEAVPVLPNDTEALLSQRILAVEHRLYSHVLQNLIPEN